MVSGNTEPPKSSVSIDDKSRLRSKCRDLSEIAFHEKAGRSQEDSFTDEIPSLTVPIFSLMSSFHWRGRFAPR